MSKLLNARKDIRSSIIVPNIGIMAAQERLGRLDTYKEGIITQAACREGTYTAVKDLINFVGEAKKFAEFIIWPNTVKVFFCGPKISFASDEAYNEDYKKVFPNGVGYHLSSATTQQRAYVIHRMRSTRQPESPMLSGLMKAVITPIIRYFCGPNAIDKAGIQVKTELYGEDSKNSSVMTITGFNNSYLIHHVVYSIVQGAIRSAYELWIEGRFLALRNLANRAEELASKSELSEEEENELLLMIEALAGQQASVKFKDAPQSYPIFSGCTKYFSEVRKEYSVCIKDNAPNIGVGTYGRGGFYQWLSVAHKEDYDKLVKSCKRFGDHTGSQLTSYGQNYNIDNVSNTPDWLYTRGLTKSAQGPVVVATTTFVAR